MELRILEQIQTLRTPLLDNFFKYFTFLGNGGWFFIVMGLILLINKKTRKTGLRVIVALLFCLFVGNLFLKPLIARPRPYWVKDVDILVKHLKDYSFPSGHSYAASAFAASLWYENKKWSAFWFALAILMGISRLYLFVHYPTDVLAGLILGIVFAILANKIVNHFYKGEVN